MTDHIISQTVLDTFHLADGDSLTIASDAGLNVDDGAGVIGEGSMSVTVDGYINSRNDGVLLEESWNAESAELTVSDSGSIISRNAYSVSLTADNISITNRGSILQNDRDSDLLFLNGEVTLENTGVIASGDRDFNTSVTIVNDRDHSEANTHSISNSGVIRGYQALSISDSKDLTDLPDSAFVTNTGKIFAQREAVTFSGLGQVEIVNAGIISGEYRSIEITSSEFFTYASIHNTASGEIFGDIICDDGVKTEAINEGIIHGSFRAHEGLTLKNSGTINGNVGSTYEPTFVTNSVQSPEQSTWASVTVSTRAVQQVS